MTALSYALDTMTSPEVKALVDSDRRFVVLLPVGSVEPHGPHLGLVTDTAISQGACVRAVPILVEGGVVARIAPPVPYGVTECAKQFAGAVSVPAEILRGFLRAVIDGYLGFGVDHVCLVNNHLEPAHDAAVRSSTEGLERRVASVACPLTRRWARTLSPEFKSGACHAGRYETSLVLAQAPELVNDAELERLPAVPISLSEKLNAGVTDFVEMGLTEAYAGAPAEASAAEGEDLYEKLATMVATEVFEALGESQ